MKIPARSATGIGVMLLAAIFSANGCDGGSDSGATTVKQSENQGKRLRQMDDFMKTQEGAKK
jgi:hypothetical protein